MKNTLTSLTVIIVREGRQLNGFLPTGFARREDTSKLRAVELNMVKFKDFHTVCGQNRPGVRFRLKRQTTISDFFTKKGILWNKPLKFTSNLLTLLAANDLQQCKLMLNQLVIV